VTEGRLDITGAPLHSQHLSTLDFFFVSDCLPGGGPKCNICTERLEHKAILKCNICGLRAHIKCGKVAPRVGRRVRLDVACPCRHGLEGATHGVRNGTRGSRSSGIIVYLTISAFLRKGGRNSAVQCQRRCIHIQRQAGSRWPTWCRRPASCGPPSRCGPISPGSTALRSFRRSC